jgi:hypothetical protein
MRWLFFLPCLFVAGPVVLKGQVVHLSQHLSLVDNGAYSDHFRDACSFVTNTASLDGTEKTSGAILSERKFLLTELSDFSAVFSLPVRNAGAGFHFDYAGSENYNESAFGLAYGRGLGRLASIGIDFHYYLFHLAGHGNAGTFGTGLGILLHPIPHLIIGLGVSDLPAGHIGREYTEKPAAVFTMGFGYEVSEEILISGEVRKEETVQVSVRVGLDYVFGNQFFAGLGVETATAAPYGKAGWQWKNIRVQLAASYHVQLGFTPLLFIMVEGKKRAA